MHELAFLSLCKLDLKKLDRRYVMIEMEGKPFRVRVLVYGGDSSNKKTLCMTHGWLGNSTGWTWMLKPLAEHYRLVLFDCASWGLNTKLDKSVALESPEAAEVWLREWSVKLFDAMTDQGMVPDKFYLAGHSVGGWLAAQYAS